MLFRTIAVSGAILLIAGLAWILWGGSETSLSRKDHRAGVPLPHIPPNPPRIADEQWREGLRFLLNTFPDSPPESTLLAKRSSPQAGESLAQSHCAVCHLYPTPNLLPKIGWVDLFLMKRRFFPNIGILEIEPQPFEQLLFSQTRNMQRANVWGDSPSGQRLSTREFFEILAYYLDHAPEKSLPQVNKPASSPESAPFEIRRLTGLGVNEQASFSLAVFEDGQLFLGTSGVPALVHIDLMGNVLRRWTLPGIPVHASRHGDDLLITLLGVEFGGVEQATGAVVRLTELFGPERTVVEPIAEGLYRSIRTVLVEPAKGTRGPAGSAAEFGGTQELDAINLQFGLLYGSVDWYKYDRDASAMRLHQRLIDAAGAVGVHVGDMNGNGRPDILVLMAQADQSLYLLHNEGNGQFRKERIFQRLPTFGFNSMTVADVNGDGRLDVITTNGDNGDLLMSTPTRNSHGVRVFLNDAAGGFEEAYFYPMHGAIQVVAGNFSGNGHLDLAAISYFPDTQAKTMETFVLLENQGPAAGLSFVPRHLAGTENKPWISMLAADVDQNGTPDIVLTSLRMGPIDPAVAETMPNVLILSNTAEPVTKPAAGPR